ncbi:MAG: FxDxF family PEP-CTERM protein [Paucibacter sp.]|nr:FxDxF family PEP-CTERM protein [Roseateles sp.]
MRKLNFLAAAAAIALAAGHASAATTNWNAHDPVELGFGAAMGANSAINDYFTFTLASNAHLLGVAVANDGGLADLTGGVVELFRYSGAGPIGLIDSFAFDGVAVTHDFGILTAGGYNYQVKASVAANAVFGTYQLNSQLAPVPEPASYALMLAGLAAVAGLARRRKTV